MMGVCPYMDMDFTGSCITCRAVLTNWIHNTYNIVTTAWAGVEVCILVYK